MAWRIRSRKRVVTMMVSFHRRSDHDAMNEIAQSWNVMICPRANKNAERAAKRLRSTLV